MQQSGAIRLPATRPVNEALAYGALSFMSVAWSAAYIAGKVVLAELPPLSTSAVRYSLAALVLLPLAWRARASWQELRSVAAPMVVMMACGGLLYQWLFLFGLHSTTATNASLLIALNPVLTVLLLALVGAERLDAQRVGGIVLALAGAAMIITRGDASSLSGLAGGSLRRGDLLTMLAALCWACFNVASRRVVHTLNAAFTNCLIYGFGGLVQALVVGPLTLSSELAGISSSAWTGLLVMSVISSVVAGQLFLYGVRVVGVSRTVVFIYVTPVLTALASVAWLGESLGVAHVLGGTAVLAGVYWSTQR
jgi:drug/metabolite transporter (DMT)-like permease